MKDNSKKALISVIVPIYNAEKYLAKCLNSILTQSYQNLEIILINDGSTDESIKIAEAFAGKDSRIRLIDKENEGVSATRNKGIDLANGDFIAFIDSDDEIDKYYFEKLSNEFFKDPEVDICICNILFVSENGIVQKDIPLSCYETQMICVDKNYKFERGLQHLSACAALYKKDIVGSIRFNEKLYIGEDALFHNQVFLKCRKAMFLCESLYHYIFHSESAFKTEFTLKRLTEIEAWERICEIYEDFCYAKYSARGELCIRSMNIFKMTCLNTKNMEKYKTFLTDLIRKNIRYINYCGANHKTYGLCLSVIISPELFAKIYRLLRQLKNYRASKKEGI